MRGTSTIPMEVKPRMPNAKVLSEKQAIVAQLTEKLQKASAGVIVDYKGITVAFTYILPVTSLLVLYKNRKFMINCGIANALIIVGAAVYRYMLGFNSASGSIIQIILMHGYQQMMQMLSGMISARKNYHSLQ